MYHMHLFYAVLEPGVVHVNLQNTMQWIADADDSSKNVTLCDLQQMVALRLMQADAYTKGWVMEGLVSAMCDALYLGSMGLEPTKVFEIRHAGESQKDGVADLVKHYISTHGEVETLEIPSMSVRETSSMGPALWAPLRQACASVVTHRWNRAWRAALGPTGAATVMWNVGPSDGLAKAAPTSHWDPYCPVGFIDKVLPMPASLLFTA